MQGVLDRQQEVATLVDRRQDHERYLFTGWGPNTAQALEVSLKIKETSFSSTEGFQVEQLLHGPFVATPPNSLLTLMLRRVPAIVARWRLPVPPPKSAHRYGKLYRRGTRSSPY